MRTTSVVLASVVASMSLAACGGDDGGTVTAIDAAVSIDAPNTDIDAPQATCTVPTAITEGAVEGTGGNSVVLKTMDSMGAPVYVWDWVPRMHDPSNPLVDYFRLVYPFPATMVGAARNLVDACTSNSDYCLLLNGDATITNGMIMETQLFFPDEGTMTITEAGDVNGGRFKATITGAKFNHYACDASGQCNLVEDGCSVTVANLSVDIAVTAPAAKLGSAVTLVPRRFHR